MKNKVKRKRRLGKAIARRRKDIETTRLDKAFRSIFVKAGILKD